MKIVKGNIWDYPADIIGVTTNSLVINSYLVMGAGVALEAAKKYPTIRLLAGKRIEKLDSNRGVYGWEVINLEKQKIGLFQTKILPRQNSTLDLIEYSTNKLITYIKLNNFEGSISLNFPGVGLGKLKKEDVEPIISILPDNVTVYYI